MTGDEIMPNKDQKCSATIAFGDDYGDNETTFHCQLNSGHDGQHHECGNLYGQAYSVYWSEE